MVLSNRQELLISSWLYVILLGIGIILQIIGQTTNNSNLLEVAKMFASGLIVAFLYNLYFLYRNYERDIQPLANDERV
jgi:hypothetical protein